MTLHSDIPDKLRRTEAALVQAEKALLVTQDRLARAEQATQAAEAELGYLRNGRLGKLRARLAGLKTRLRGQTPAKPPCRPAPVGSADGTRPRCTLPGRTILVIDSSLPLHDQDSGSLRLFYLLKMMRDLGYAVLFFPHDGLRLEPYATDLQTLGIEILDDAGTGGDPEERLRPWLPWVDVAWVSRPGPYDDYTPLLWRNPATQVIFDTVDLHFVRLRREWELTPDRTVEGERTWREMQMRELRAARLADATVVVTDEEAQLLRELGVENVVVVSNIHPQYAGKIPEAEQREGLLFIGGYRHLPNVDAVQWLCEAVMPLIWRQEPGLRLTLLGSSPTDAVTALAGENVIVPGYVKDVEPYFLQSRVFVAPLRYGAGMKGKVGQSLSYGLPTVVTSIAAEGIGLVHGVSAMIADDPERFARCVLDLYRDPDLWKAVSQASLQAVSRYGTDQVQRQLDVILTNVSAPRPSC